MNGKGTKEAERDSKLSISPSPSTASSNASLVTPPTNTPPEVRDSVITPVRSVRHFPSRRCPDLSDWSLRPQGVITDNIPALNLSLQQVKELAHQKRSNKRAPPMDWTKKNELFSNL